MSDLRPTTRTTRLAPSPTGTLHLGNALSFAVNWALARKLGWGVLLRIEDLDAGRVKPGSAEQTVELLRWLGLDWDAGPIRQSDNLEPYEVALKSLRDRGLLYPCSATRKEIAQALTAPHEGEHETRYPGLNRPSLPLPTPEEPDPAAPPLLEDDAYAWRLVVPDKSVTFVDQLQGPASINVQQQVGDFALATKAGLPSYQLAVVVDDARQGVTDVVRGEDLIRSTARQVLLYEMLGLGQPPRYWHLPLVRGKDGRRLAKRDGSVRMSTYKDAGVPGERVLGLLGYWAGLLERPAPMSADALVDAIDPAKLSYPSPTLNEADEQWLMQNNGATR